MKGIMLFMKKVVAHCFLLIRTGIIIQRTRCNQYTFLPSYFDSVSPHDCICFWVIQVTPSVQDEPYPLGFNPLDGDSMAVEVLVMRQHAPIDPPDPFRGISDINVAAFLFLQPWGLRQIGVE